MDEINKRSIELSSLRESHSSGSNRVTLTELRSPVRDTMKQRHINTAGGVATPGESIMKIVPLNAPCGQKPAHIRRMYLSCIRARRSWSGFLPAISPFTEGRTTSWSPWMFDSRGGEMPAPHALCELALGLIAHRPLCTVLLNCATVELQEASQELVNRLPEYWRCRLTVQNCGSLGN